MVLTATGEVVKCIMSSVKCIQKVEQDQVFPRFIPCDQQNDLENRLKACQGLDLTVLQELQEMLKQVNPYAQIYLQAGVFKLKLHALLHDIYFGSTHALGKMVALIYVI